jgi:hypothetical protein
MKLLKLFFPLFFLGLFFVVVGKANAQDIASVLFETQSSPIPGVPLKVNVFINSNVPVNAAQVSITYPQSNFSLLSIDSSTSSFSIKAEEEASPGLIKIARGNIKALSGKNLLVVLNMKPLNNSASTVQLGYLPNDSLVMSETNVNILTGSQVLTIKPNVPTPTNAIQAFTHNGKVVSKGFIAIISQAVKEFFHDLFH